VFAALTNLTQAAQSGSGVTTAVAQLRTAFEQYRAADLLWLKATAARNAANFIAGDKVQLSTQENTAVGIDLAGPRRRPEGPDPACCLLAAGGKIQPLAYWTF